MEKTKEIRLLEIAREKAILAEKLKKWNPIAVVPLGPDNPGQGFNNLDELREHVELPLRMDALVSEEYLLRNQK